VITVAVLLVLLAGPAAAAEECTSCHEDAHLTGSVHEGLDCTSCHEAIAAYPHPDPIPSPSCAACHEDAVREHARSVHAQQKDRPDTPGCVSCHGKGHAILPPSDPASPVAKRNLAATCGACHADPEFLARHQNPTRRLGNPCLRTDPG